MIMKKLNDKGFSLIEIIISLALAAILAVAVSAVVISSYRIKEINHQKLECVALSKSIVDEIISANEEWVSRDNLEAWLMDRGYRKEAGDLYEKTVRDNVKFNYRIQVQIIDAGMENLFDIKVTSSSADVRGVSITRRLRSG